MTQDEEFSPERLLKILPRREIKRIPIGAMVPRERAVGNLSDYNGFTGKERLRTFEVAKWLFRIGAMPHSGKCDLCGCTADQQHAEDYYDFATWIDLCRGCHTRLHQRFRYRQAWRDWLDRLSMTTEHWARHIAPTPFDLASLVRAKGNREPRFEDFRNRQTAR